MPRMARPLVLSAALILAGGSIGISSAEENARPMWEIARSWNCHFIQEFRCSSEAKACNANDNKKEVHDENRIP